MDTEAYEAARQHLRAFQWHEEHEDGLPNAAARLLDIVALKRAANLLERETREQWDDESNGETDITPTTPETSLAVEEFAPRYTPSLLDLTLSLRSAVIGQDAAVGAVAERVVASLSGLKLRPERPHAVVMLNGPSGSGKTTLAKQLALAAYDDADALIRIDMAEMRDSQDARMRLIGGSRVWKNSTPEGLLTTRVIEKPRSVILLDELEKAHRDVHQLFLRVFDEGTLTDGHGQIADFSETIIVMTSNLAADGDSRKPEDVLTPEFLGRVDVSVAFQPLSPETVHQIAVKEVQSAVLRVRRQGWWLDLDENVVDWIAENTRGTGIGARGVQHAVERLLLTPLVAFERGPVRIGIRPDGRALTFESQDLSTEA